MSFTKSIGAWARRFLVPQAQANGRKPIPKAEFDAIMADPKRKAAQAAEWAKGNSWIVETPDKKPVATKELDFTPTQKAKLKAALTRVINEVEAAQKAKAPAAKKPTATAPKKVHVEPAKPKDGADLIADKMKSKYPSAAKKGIAAAVETYSAKNKEMNLHPFAKAAERIRKNPSNF